MRILLALVFCPIAFARPAAAQALEGCGTRWEQLSTGFVRVGEHHYRRVGNVQVSCADMMFFADEMDLHSDTNVLTASGNVVFTSGGNRIGADRMEFDTKTRTGTFYNAAGTATLGDRVDRSLFGTQEPDAYFYGEKIEKLGPRKYRITRGGFTTCVQPTPRWEITSGTATLTLDEYAFLRNSILRVKGVPLLYLPVFYYPIQEDDRATGFLIPTYGGSTYRGQTISNAFFWAIGRSHDATFFHDWFSKTGQQVGSEYRYVLGPESTGNARASFLDEHAVEVASQGGGVDSRPGQRSYRVDGAANQRLPLGLRARGQVQYFSSIQTQQLYQQNVYDASNRQRSFGVNVSGVWGTHSLSGTYDRSEVFYFGSEENSNLRGSAPRINYARSERPIGQTPIYFSLAGEYTAQIRRDRQGDEVFDRGLQRVDLLPQMRLPFTRWPFLTINSSAGWRTTWWSESYDPDTLNQNPPVQAVQINDGLGRSYFDLQSMITGPVFTRIFNTPGSGYADKFKHVIEPSVNLQRTTAVDEFDRIVKLDGTDSVVGGVTRIAYGLTNRIYAKRRSGGTPGVAREILTFGLTQSYYTDANAARFDQNYQTSYGTAPPSKLSPIAAIVRGSPTDELNGELRAEYDTDISLLRTINASGTWRRQHIDVIASWSLRRTPLTSDPNSELRRDQYLNAATSVRTTRNRIGGRYSFYLDLENGSLLEQRIVGYYNAQCCGIGVEYQTYSFSRFASPGIPKDRRFNISFTLAGIGTFSNLLGAFGGDTVAR
ncbi:MAG: LPS-assembly protein LptD [Vicinamibacterales bacterium]